MAPPRLFLRFAVFSGIALLVAVGLALLLVRWNVQDRARSRAVGEARSLATQFSADDLSRIAFQYWGPRGRAAGDRLKFVDDFFDPTVAGSQPANVVLFSPGGEITYAADRSLIGTHPPDAARVRAALTHPQYAVVKGEQASYVPVFSAYRPGTALGVLRLEHAYGPIASEIQSDFGSEAGTIALALVALYLAMLPLMRRVTSSMRRSYVERAELAAIVDHSNDAIVAQTPDGVITSWNAGAEYVYGWKAEEVVGRSIDLLLPDERGVEPASELELARTTHLRKDGAPVEVSVTVSPIRDANGELVGSSMITRDVTEIARLELELREAHRQEAVGRLAGGIAKDFGDVLDEIDGAATSLLLDPASQRELDRIRQAAARGASLVTQLLAVGGVQESNPELLDLNAAIREAAPRLRELVGPRITIELELDEALGLVVADREQIEQLILNLAANARGSMPLGGLISVQTANVDFARRSRSGGHELGHFVMFAVSDTGSGLTQETAERPYEPFVRRGEGGERMALGLAAVCGIVKQSGGTMGIESRREGGTVIRTYLPRAGMPEATPLQLDDLSTARS
jgi:PAS domain S-box-containing protein